jgi:hypothetical protein
MKAAIRLAVAAALATAGCGSTLQSGGAGSSQALQPGGQSASSATSTGPAPGQLTVPGPNAPGGALAGAANAAGGQTVSTSPNGGTTVREANGQVIHLAPGVTTKTVKIGVPYATDAGAADAETGAAALNPGNTKAESQAIWDWVNAHGGLGGRKAVLDFYGIPATTSDANQSFQAACQHFVQDQHDFVVLNKGTTNFNQCLEKGGVLHVASDLTLNQASDVKLLPHNIQPAGVTLDDSARSLVSGLLAAGYFNGTAVKVGIMSFDDPAFKAVINGIMLPALKAAGHPVAAQDVQLAHAPNSVSDYGSMDSDATNAAVRFRTDGVTNVLLFDSAGALTQGFLAAAEAQHAHFNYGVNSQNGMQVGLEAGDVPTDQAVGSVGVGWLPDFDVVASARPANALAKKCRDIMSHAGYPANGDNADVIQLFMCQDAWTLQAAFGNATGDITRDTMVSAIVNLGSALPNVANYGVRLDGTHHDGVDVIRLYAYDQGCGCYVYRSGNKPLSSTRARTRPAA